MGKIKLRYWSESERKYISADNMPLIGENSQYLELTPYDDDRFELFSGQKDNKGNDIYEGDIMTGNLIVIFMEGVFKTTYENDTSGGSLLTKKRCQYLEIIGNIHKEKE